MPRALRPCATPNCPALVTKGTRHCSACATTAERRRGTPAQRGYDAKHRRLRASWATRVARGEVLCARCGQPITGAWDLGHTDDRTAWTGPEHATCNRAAGGRAAHGVGG